MKHMVMFVSHIGRACGPPVARAVNHTSIGCVGGVVLVSCSNLKVCCCCCLVALAHEELYRVDVIKSHVIKLIKNNNF